MKNGNQSLRVNALLDDASTKTYINHDVAAKLGLQGEKEMVMVNVLDGNVEAIETMPVKLTLESVNGRASTSVTAYQQLGLLET